MNNKILYIATLSLIGIFTKECFANTVFPSGRFQISAIATKEAILNGDAMQPFYNQNDNLVYADLMGGNGANNNGPDDYIVSPGIGYRHVADNQIYGAYFFTDYEKTNNGGHFWVYSPGVEWMNPHWDAHVNFYLPSNTTQAVGSPVFANDVGIYDNINYVGHDQYDAKLQTYNVIGTGSDAAVGYSFENEYHLRSRIFLGTYYYHVSDEDFIPQSNIQNITGITLGYKKAMSKNFSVSLTNSYDEVSHYTLAINLTWVLGGDTNVYSENIEDRLLDPVDRHIGIIGTAAGTYDQEGYEDLGQALQYDNVYFVNSTGSGDLSGTYGNEAVLTQDFLNSLEPDARVYMQENNYNFGSTSFILPEEISFFGKSDNYKSPAIVTLNFENNGFIIDATDDSIVSFSDLNIVGSNVNDTTGISLTNTSNAILNFNDVTVSNFSTGVYADNQSSGTLIINTNNSRFIDNSNTENNGAAYGMNVINENNGSVTINATDSNFNGNSTTGNDSQVAGLAILNTGSGNATVNAIHSTFNQNTTTGSNHSMAVGLYAINNAEGVFSINATSSQFNANQSTNFEAFGMETVNASSGTLLVSSNNSTFNNNSAGVLSAGLYVANLGTGQVTVQNNNSDFMNNTGEFGYGLDAQNLGAGSLTVNNINIQTGGNTTTGINES